MTVFEINVSVEGEIEEAEEEEEELLSTLDISVKYSVQVTNNYKFSYRNPTNIPQICMRSHMIQRPKACRCRIESGLARSCSSLDDLSLRRAAELLIRAIYVQSDCNRVTPIDFLAERVASTASSWAWSLTQNPNHSSDWANSAGVQLKLKFRLVAQIEFVRGSGLLDEILKTKLIRDAFDKLTEHRLIIPIDDDGQFQLEGDCCICCQVLWDHTTTTTTKFPTDHLIRLPNCKHVFHQNCLFTWFQKSNSCPLCRCLLISS